MSGELGTVATHVRGFLDRIVGSETTLKRETILFVCWPMLWVLVVGMFFVVSPADLQKYEATYRYTLDTVFWLMLSIFGLQTGPRVAEIVKGGTTRETTTVDTADTTVKTETVTTPTPPPATPPAQQ